MVNADRSGSRKVTWESGNDFVFAFRVRRVLVRKKTGGVKSEDEYNDGAMFGRYEDQEPEEPELEVVFDDEVDVEGLQYEELQDEDETVRCVLPANRP